MRDDTERRGTRDVRRGTAVRTHHQRGVRVTKLECGPDQRVGDEGPVGVEWREPDVQGPGHLVQPRTQQELHSTLDMESTATLQYRRRHRHKDHATWQTLVA